MYTYTVTYNTYAHIHTMTAVLEIPLARTCGCLSLCVFVCVCVCVGVCVCVCVCRSEVMYLVVADQLNCKCLNSTKYEPWRRIPPQVEVAVLLLNSVCFQLTIM